MDPLLYNESRPKGDEPAVFEALAERQLVQAA